MRRSLPSLPVPKRSSQENWPCVQARGPGNLHLINGLFDCHRNHVPVLAIAAHIPLPKSAAAIFRRRIRRSCSVNAATTVSWFHPGADPAGAGDRHAQSRTKPWRFRGRYPGRCGAQGCA